MQLPHKGAESFKRTDSQKPVIAPLTAFFPEFNHRLIHRLVIRF